VTASNRPIPVSTFPSRRCPSRNDARPRKEATNFDSGRSNTDSGRPTCSICPSFITATRSEMESASSWSWVTETAVTPAAFRIWRTSSRISTRSRTSRFENGSSRRSTSGSGASDRASATRCFCPPESWSGVFSPCSGQIDEVEHLVDAVCGRVRAVAEPERDVLPDGEVGKQREVLEDDPDIALFGGRTHRRRRRSRRRA